MGKEGQYDLRLADSISTIITPDTETEEDASLIEMQLTGNSHPTKLLKNASMKMLKLISVSVGLYGDQIEKCGISNVASMFRTLLASKIGIFNFGLEHWTTLGFLRAIAQPKQLSKCLTSPVWLKLYIDMLNSVSTCEQDVYKKVQCIRLLNATLVHWDDDESELIEKLLAKLFECLGRIVLLCPNDLSMLHASVDVKSRVLLSASHSGTVGEELVSLLRKLHCLPFWNNAISSYLSQKLCIAAEFLTESTDAANGRESISRHINLESEKAYVVAALNTIGGCDPRPRIGLRIQSGGSNDGTITTFTSKGKALISYAIIDGSNFPEKKKISITTAASCADIIPFNLNRLPLNEMLLNALTVLIYGPGEWKPHSKAIVDVNLLRMEQIHLATLNATTVLFKHQGSLRKILRQRCPGVSRYSSNESISEHVQQNHVIVNVNTVKTENVTDEKKSTPEANRKADNLVQQNQSPISEDDDENAEEDDEKYRVTNELLIQNILSRATQTNPLKSIYSYAELSLAALNLSQQLASNLYAENSVPYYSSEAGTSSHCIAAQVVKPPLPPLQPTLIHGVPIYNDAVSI